jgi:hypothetical protein
MACDKCHDERGFKMPWVKEHHREEFAFALKGKHAGMECRQCHNQQIKAQELAARMPVNLIAADCRNCHQDPHQNQMGAACDTCHSEAGWTGSVLLFSHNQQASFKLEGPHAATACEACHGSDQRRYRPVAHECSECHQTQSLAMQGITPSLQGAADFHQGRVSCTDCHDLQKAGQRLDEFAQKCAGCHNPYYGALLFAWSDSFARSRLDAEQALKQIADPADERRAPLEQLIAELRQIGVHNIRLSRQLWEQARNTQPDMAAGR